MKYYLAVFIACSFTLSLQAQEDPYVDSLKVFREKYISTHEVIKGEDRSLLRFYPIRREYCVPARLERIEEAPWFSMETTGAVKKVFRVFGILHFRLQGRDSKLHVYQSRSLMDNPAYSQYLMIAFTDSTSGEETYEVGRYIDLSIPEIGAPGFRLDFNKAYNPYCAYISNQFNCPVPPRENHLPQAVKAGEMKYAGHH